MYLRFFRVGRDKEGRILTIEDIEKDTKAFLDMFEFQQRFVDPENFERRLPEKRRLPKIYMQYENEDLAIGALKVITPTNTLVYEDVIKGPNGGKREVIFACCLGLFGLPEPHKLSPVSRKIVIALDNLQKKYGSLDDSQLEEPGTGVLENYRKLLPARNFFAFRTGMEKGGRILTTDALDNKMSSMLITEFGFHKAYLDPENIDSRQGFTKVYTQFEIVGGGINAFKVFALDGNYLRYEDRNTSFACTAFLGFLGIPPHEKMSETQRDMMRAFTQLQAKYHRGLKDVKKDR